jgi:16S rRNA (guanine1207-N2)-methyltransferase
MVRISYEVADTMIVADTQPDLFSPKGLDMGSQLLLESVAKLSYKKVLDWGCGWGAIALWLAKHNPSAQVIALDSDIAAVAATRANAKAEKLTNLEVIPSHGYAQLAAGEVYDLICSNPPTHRGREVVDSMIAESFDRLTEGGKLLLVVEARIKPWVAREMAKVFGSYKIVKRGPKNVVLASVKQEPVL